MKQSKWDIFFGGLFYASPFWVMLIPILVDNFKLDKPMDDTFTLALASMCAFWCMGMSLMRTQNLEDEVEKLNKKLGEKE